MIKLILLLCVLSFNVNSKTTTFHFTDMEGPSEASGDCGGLSVWLKLDIEKAQFIGGEFNEYEGGCKVYPKEIVEIKHNPITGTVMFYSKYFSDDVYLKFKGVYHYESLSLGGEFFEVNVKDLKPVSTYKKNRTLYLKK
jgi:hypothetical protein